MAVRFDNSSLVHISVLDLQRKVLSGLRLLPFQLLLSSLFERLDQRHVYLSSIVRGEHVLLYNCRSFFDNRSKSGALYHELKIKVQARLFLLKRIIERGRNLPSEIVWLGYHQIDCVIKFLLNFFVFIL